MTRSNCRGEGHNKLTCKNIAYVVQGPTRKRGRPPKVNDGINTHQPNRRKTSAVTPTPRPRVIQTQPATAPQQNLSQSSIAAPSSSAPQPSLSQSSIAVTGRGRGRGRGQRGRPPRRQQARKVTVPIGHGVYMCPYSDRVFEVFGSKSREVTQRGICIWEEGRWEEGKEEESFE